MSNILLSSNRFRDDSNNPSSYWNGQGYAIQTSGNQVTLTLLNPETLTSEDFLSAVFTNREDDILRVSIIVTDQTGNHPENYVLNSNEAVLVEVNNLTNIESLQISFTSDETGSSNGLDILIGADEEPPVVIQPGQDTYSAKGFISFGSLVNNANRVVAPLGELSVFAQTFTRDREHFSTGSGGATDTAITASVFSSRAVVDGKVPVPADYGNLFATMGSWMFTQASDGNFTSDPEVFRQALLAEFGDKIGQIALGRMMQQGAIWLPEYVVFYANAATIIVGGSPPAYLEKSRVKLWLADASFRAQYDEYSYNFVAPIDVLDDFFKPRDQVEALLAARTQQDTLLKVRVLEDKDPYTYLQGERFDFCDPDEPAYRKPTDWTFLIYGAAGLNIDAQKEELAKWILDNSIHTREEWAEIFPDIFTSTEFIIVPLWTHYAIPNETLLIGVYSPTVLMTYGQTVARKMCIGTNYTNIHVDTVLTSVACTYKSVALLAVGGPENRGGINKFYDQWRDYIAVGTTSTDFDRMHPDTQAWVSLLHRMLKVAEELTEFSEIPVGMTRVRRTRSDGTAVTYVVASYKNVQYLVASKLSVEQYFPVQGTSDLAFDFDGDDSVESLPNGYQQTPYAFSFEAKGGNPPYHWELVGPKHPLIDNHAIDPVTGEYTAYANQWGDATVTVMLSDTPGGSGGMGIMAAPGANTVTKTFNLYFMGLA